MKTCMTCMPVSVCLSRHDTERAGLIIQVSLSTMVYLVVPTRRPEWPLFLEALSPRGVPELRTLAGDCL